MSEKTVENDHFMALIRLNKIEDKHFLSISKGTMNSQGKPFPVKGKSVFLGTDGDFARKVLETALEVLK